MRRLRAGSRRGTALLFGVLLLTGIVFLVLAGLRLSEGSLRQAELDRERGRVWAMTCGALHRAVQAGMVTGPSAVVPGPVVAPAVVTVAQLKQPPVPPPPAPPFPPFLPAGLAGVATAGASGLTARYGAVVEAARGVPIAVCALSGADLAARAGSLREGAVMGGLELVGVVGGEDTPMHARLPAVQLLFGTLADGTLFATADFGVAHRTERLHRRPVGGRPDLARMEQRVRFQGSGNVVGVAEMTAAEAESVGGAASGARVEVGSVVDTSLLVLSSGSAATVSAGQGFAFGGVQTVFSLPGELAVGTLLNAGDLALESRGPLSAESMTLTGLLTVDEGIQAVTGAGAGSLGGHPREFALVVYQEFDREGVCGDWLLRRARPGCPDGGVMETALDMGGNDLVSVGRLEAQDVRVSDEFAVTGNWRIDGELAVGTSLNVTGGWNVPDGLVFTGAAEFTGLVRANEVDVTRSLEAETATVDRTLTAGTVTAQGNLRAPNVTATTFDADSGAFNSLSVGGCSGCL